MPIDDTPKTGKCKSCNKIVRLDDCYTYSAHRGKGPEWIINAYCSKACKDVDIHKCSECKKEVFWADAYRRSESGFMDPREGKWVDCTQVWCSEECWTAKEKRSKRNGRIAEALYWSYIVVPWIIAVCVPTYYLYEFWPNVISALLRIFPICAVLFGLFFLHMHFACRHALGSTTGIFGTWMIGPGVALGGVCILSAITFVIVNLYQGMRIWWGA